MTLKAPLRAIHNLSEWLEQDLVERLEKMISGMYLGEMYRITLLHPNVKAAFSPAFASALDAKCAERMLLRLQMEHRLYSTTTKPEGIILTWVFGSVRF